MDTGQANTTRSTSHRGGAQPRRRHKRVDTGQAKHDSKHVAPWRGTTTAKAQTCGYRPSESRLEAPAPVSTACLPRGRPLKRRRGFTLARFPEALTLDNHPVPSPLTSAARQRGAQTCGCLQAKRNTTRSTPPLPVLPVWLPRGRSPPPALPRRGAPFPPRRPPSSGRRPPGSA